MVADRDPIDPLTSMLALKHLRIAAVFLFGTDSSAAPPGPTHGHYAWNASSQRRLIGFLPPSLEVLHITHADDHFLNLLRALHHLLEERTERLPRLYEDERILPHLRRIIIEGAVHENEGLWPRLAYIKALIECQGLACEIAEAPRCIPDQDPGSERRWGMQGEFEWAEGVDGINRLPASQTVDLGTTGAAWPDRMDG